MKAEHLNEKWFKFTRIFCKEGYIDMWGGDCAHDPNLDSKSSYNLNNSVIYFRLNGEGEWISKNELKGLFEDINTYHEIFTSNELWGMAQVNAIRRAIGKDKLFCEQLYKVHGDFRIAIEWYRLNSGISIN
jgi:hypothetical protein